MMRNKVILLLLAWSVSFLTPAIGASLEDGGRAREQLGRSFIAMVEKADFGALEKQADEMRAKQLRFTDGGWKLNAFYQFPEKLTDEEWLKLIASIESWNGAFPMSVNGRVALAWAWYKYAWFARGGGYSDSVTEGGRDKFEDRLMRAYELAKEPGSPTDCPARYELLLKLARSLGADEEVYDFIFKEAVSFAPDYHYYYLEKATNLLPRWGGKPGAWLRFAEKAKNEAASRNGKALYARIISHVQQQGELKSFKDSGVSWLDLRDGYYEIMRTSPGSDFNTNRLAMFACVAGDDLTARSLLGEDFSYFSEAWKGVDPDLCLKKLKLPTLPERTKSNMQKRFSELNESVFKQSMELAAKGSRKAMADVAATYYYGGTVAKDDVKAYAWLVLSGERRDLLEKISASMSSEQQDQGRKEVERLKQLIFQ